MTTMTTVKPKMLRRYKTWSWSVTIIAVPIEAFSDPTTAWWVLGIQGAFLIGLTIGDVVLQ